MRRFTMLILIAAVAMVITAGTAAAQPKQGDVVFTVYGGSTPGMYYYSGWPGSLRTIRAGITLAAVKMSFGNYFGIASGGSSGNIYSFNDTGAYTTLTTLTPRGDGIALDQDGAYMVASGADNKLYRVIGTSATAWVTLPTTYGFPNCICRDGNTGDWIVGTYGAASAGYLLRVNRLTKAVSVFSTLTGAGIYGVDWVPQTGEYVAARVSGSRYYMTWVTSSGSMRLNYGSANSFNCVTVDQKNARVFGGCANGLIYEWTHTGSYRRSIATGMGNISGIDIWQDQNVTVQTLTNRLARVQLKFWDSPGRSYYVGLATHSVPGINLGAPGWVNLKPDPLLFLTVGGGAVNFTYRFTGVLSSSGYATSIYFVLPYTPVRVYVSAVAVNPSKPGGLDVGNVEVVDAW